MIKITIDAPDTCEELVAAAIRYHHRLSDNPRIVLTMCAGDVLDDICENYIRRCCVLVEGAPYHHAIESLDEDIREIVMHEVDELVEIACIDAMTTRLIRYYDRGGLDAPPVLH